MEKNCPCCGKHCPVDHLSCPTGRAHFGIREEERPVNPEEKMILLLRKCGHFLHHSAGNGGDTAALTNALTPEERTTLETLLEKCLASWNKEE